MVRAGGSNCGPSGAADAGRIGEAFHVGASRAHARTRRTSLRRPVHAVILQEACAHAPRVLDQFIACTGGTDLAILLNKDTFEPDGVSTISEASSSEDTWSLAALVVRGLLSPPSLSGSPYGHVPLSPCPQYSGPNTPRLDLSSSTPSRCHGPLGSRRHSECFFTN